MNVLYNFRVYKYVVYRRCSLSINNFLYKCLVGYDPFCSCIEYLPKYIFYGYFYMKLIFSLYEYQKISTLMLYQYSKTNHYNFIEFYFKYCHVPCCHFSFRLGQRHETVKIPTLIL